MAALRQHPSRRRNARDAPKGAKVVTPTGTNPLTFDGLSHHLVPIRQLLHLCMERHCANTQAIAELLETAPQGAKVDKFVPRSKSVNLRKVC
ncbi:hypothetical protein T484DRAFT_1961537 [Baffinella frigidus]|nr:hypothetical protein T484DRAFT_1961537 [Cryptophyta sp. CCMP2293]